MELITPTLSTDGDESIARELEQQLRARPIRNVASRYSTVQMASVKTHQTKRGRPKKVIPQQPVSLKQTLSASSENFVYSQQKFSSDSDSSRLSTPPSSEDLSSGGEEEDVNQMPALPEAAENSNIPFSVSSGKAIRGITNVQVSEGDSLSSPLPGPELLKLVEEAKQHNELPTLYNSSVFRLIGGTWMVPQMCRSCQHPSPSELSRQCDRNYPCSVCTTIGVECRKGCFMTIVYRPKVQKSELLKFSNATPSLQLNILAVTHHVHQSSNGTWNAVPVLEGEPENSGKRKFDNIRTNLSESSLTYPIKKTKKSEIIKFCISPQILKPGMANSGNFHDQVNEPYDASSIKFSIEIEPAKRGRRRKVKGKAIIKDAELEPYRDVSTSEPGVISARDSSPPSPELPASKRRAIGVKKRITSVKKSGGYVKYHQSAQDDKPDPYGKPPVWADKRQSLCETLPYYRAYMSGAYTHDKLVQAFMVDKEVGARDRFDDEILIARVGGGRTFDDESGQMIQTTDQTKSGIACAFIRTRERSLPVVVIAGQGNKISPSKLPHYYNVLDWFHVTDVWCEKSRGLKCWMVRLEKIATAEKSWWAPVNSPPLDPARNYDGFKSSFASCRTCKASSKQIYTIGWTCLETECLAYFKFGKDFHDSDLDYVPEFLKERSDYRGVEPGPLAPSHVTNIDIQKRGGAGIEKDCKAGIICPKCNGCIRRIYWDHWSCETQGCNYKYRVDQTPIKAHDAISQSVVKVNEICNENFGIRTRVSIMGQYDVFEYIMPGEKGEPVGIVRHFKADGIINSQPDGPNDLFQLMQESDFGLKRHPSRQKGSTLETLTSHWAANFGAPYKYGVSVATRSFKDAPTVILKALKRLTWAGKQTVSEALEPFHVFNELLCIGYFEDSLIGYHDDGESTLGPTVATLSLGASAVMSLRPKAKAVLGPASKNTKGTKMDVLKFVLRHGDIIIMHGAGVQKFYEHTVVPQGKLRFALTSRYICPEALQSDVERADAAIKSELPTGHEAYDYIGDKGSTLRVVDEVDDEVSELAKLTNSLMGRALAGNMSTTNIWNVKDTLDNASKTFPSPIETSGIVGHN